MFTIYFNFVRDLVSVCLHFRCLFRASAACVFMPSGLFLTGRMFAVFY